MFFKWFSLLATLSTVVVVDANLFTSVHEMENLAHYEQRLLEHLQSYLLEQQMKLDFITQKYDELSNRRVDNTPQNNLGNPITAFALVKRLVRDWPLVLNILVENYVLPNHLMHLPREKELQSALRGLARLKDVYNLSAAQLANGIIGDFQDKTIMTASDCYDMGKYSYKHMDFHTSISWFNEATKKIQNGDKTIQQDKVLAHIFLASTFAGCLVPRQTNSNQLLQQLLSEFPNFTLNHDFSHDYSEALIKNCSWIREMKKKHFSGDDEKYDMIYSKLCLGDFNTTTSRLRCYYVHYGNPRLLIAPFKLEEIHLDPPLIVFHDVISDQEIEKMKSNFHKNWRHCMIINNNTSALSTDRTCEVAWVTDKDPTSARLSRRVRDMTDLSIDTSEENQVAYYGLGGEFKMHVDYIANESLSEVNHEGNRLATLMFYLKDVESGGYTVFPVLHKAVIPRKGTALFWFNLNDQGKGLIKMLHGGCPVLQGTKLVLNKWIHEGNQDFEKQCPSDRNFPKRQFYLNTKR
ncbi:prolyl 4-hydroxylase subunit alpha-1-like isoform X2 [Homalodisca vitripennis]|nr:prolyl 4-hydroxylase subunit alpha-1-like isoform X2 [Homalodisca vitripennis]